MIDTQYRCCQAASIDPSAMSEPIKILEKVDRKSAILKEVPVRKQNIYERPPKFAIAHRKTMTYLIWARRRRHLDHEWRNRLSGTNLTLTNSYICPFQKWILFLSDNVVHKQGMENDSTLIKSSAKTKACFTKSRSRGKQREENSEKKKRAAASSN